MIGLFRDDVSEGVPDIQFIDLEGLEKLLDRGYRVFHDDLPLVLSVKDGVHLIFKGTCHVNGHDCWQVLGKYIDDFFP